ncbi:MULTISPECIES: type II toxin-antitoxin system VapB family antitoxin [unclassified Sphingomonas]|jgi:Arc/MetJ family transcription regulator|uniref:type II toxin-antitoxin system VapB family antitoxin n=1 Tax=unclassified Sphingomonas TaxID=196159 RepID=UPI00082A8916|nr:MULTISPECIES: type II toxin-antitoxin system VapB family antitoxin [unclassified Sphingomonas]MCH4894477.1 type II toxin-antitoxin system VapB family antitoxin [Sphingomonas sp. SFZ2018-12]
MRTNIDIDDDLMAEAIKATGAKTKKEAVEIALRKTVQIGRQREILKYFGKIDWQGDLDAMRRDD